MLDVKHNSLAKVLLYRRFNQIRNFTYSVISRGNVEYPEIFGAASIARMYALVASSILRMGRQIEGLFDDNFIFLKRRLKHCIDNKI